MKRIIAMICTTTLCISNVAYGSQLYNTDALKLLNETQTISSPQKLAYSSESGITPYADETEYKIGKTTDTDVIAKLGTDGILKITGSGDTISFTKAPWSAKASDIVSVTMDSTVTPTSMDYWFANCTKLTTVPSIPSSVTSMVGTFKECDALVNAPNMSSANLLTDMNSTFYGCKVLTGSITLPNSVTNLDFTFQNCVALTNAPSIPSSAETMIQTFKGCTELISGPSSIPNSVKKVDFLFDGCAKMTSAPNLQSLNLVTNMTGVYNGCKLLASAPSLPSSTTNLSKTFNGCETITSPPNIPGTVKSMSESFRGCKALTSAPSIPNGVDDFSYTFSGCTVLTGTITIPDSIKNISTSFVGTVAPITVVTSFENKGILVGLPSNVTGSNTNITITWDIGKTVGTVTANWDEPNKTLTILGNGEMKDFKADNSWDTNQKYTSADWYALVRDEVEMKVDIQSGVTNVGNNAFFGAIITSLSIPSSCVKIGESAFENTIITTAADKPLKIDNANCVIDKRAFADSHKLSYLEINAKTIGEKAFYKGGTGRRNKPFGEGDKLSIAKLDVESVGAYSFSNALEDTSEGPVIEFTLKLNTVNESAFENKGVKGLIIPTNVNLKAKAFKNCKDLPGVMIVNSISGESVFENCAKITSIAINGNINEIGANTFSGCSGLTSVTLPSTVKIIGANAFNNCIELATLALPNSIETIGSNAFYNCQKLTNIVLPTDLKTIGDSVFDGCIALKNIELPKNVTTIGKTLFTKCSELEIVKNYSTIKQTIALPIFKEGANSKLKEVHGYDTNETFKKDVENAKYKWVSILEADIIKPEVTGVAVNVSKIDITATDNIGVTQYGYSATNNSADVTNWQADKTFNSVVQGKTYYAFAKDAVGNISNGFEFIVADVDIPVISAVIIDAVNKKATVTATDNIAIATYGISVTDASTGVTNWQTSNEFTNLDINKNYYAFVKDTSGNISAAKIFTITDANAPTISSVVVNNKDRKAVVNAIDNVAVKAYGYSATNNNATVTNWQTTNEFVNIPVNQPLFAFVKDDANNISTSYPFTANKIIASILTLNTTTFKKEYTYGESLNLTGLTATVKYNDDVTDTIPVTIAMVSGYSPTLIGKQTLTVAVADGIDKTVEVNVNDVISTLNVSGVKTVYQKDEAFSSSGTLIINYQHGSPSKSMPIDSSMLKNINTSVAGASTITLTYLGVDFTYAITVESPAVDAIESIRIDGAKTQYFKDETFFTQGSVIATYTSGKTKTVALVSSMLTNFSTAAVGNFTVNVKYTEGGIDYTTSYSIVIKDVVPETPVTITATVDDTVFSRSKIVNINTTGDFKEIVTPGGKVYTSPLNYTIVENGSYIFSILGKDEKHTDSEVVEITKIDKEAPIIFFAYSSDGRSVDVDVRDNCKVDRLEILPTTTAAITLPFNYSLSNGGCTFLAYDEAGNMSSKDLLVQNVPISGSTTDTTIMLSGMPTTWTNKSTDISVGAFNAVDGVRNVDLVQGDAGHQSLRYNTNIEYYKLAEVIDNSITMSENTANTIGLCSNTLEDGISKIPVITEVPVTENGVYTYVVQGPYGSYTEQVNINYIDMEAPIINVTTNSGTAQISITDSLSGIRTIILPDGTSINNTSAGVLDYSEKLNLQSGEYEIYAEDHAGNTSKQKFNIDKVNDDIKIKVTYNLNGGSGTADADAEYLEGSLITVSDVGNIVAPSGKEFKEWNTKSDGTGTAYAPGTTITAKASDITLYAIYKDKQSSGGGSSGGGGGGGTSSGSDNKKPDEIKDTNLKKPEEKETAVEATISLAGGIDKNGQPVKMKNGFEINSTEVSKGYISGYTDGTFKPSSGITRQEFASIIDRILKSDKSQVSSTFEDMNGKWGNMAVARLAAKGVVSGSGNNKFEPERNITREEVIIILSRIIDLSGYSTECTLLDIEGSQNKDDISRAYNAGIISGFGNKFNARNNITRAEVVTILNKILYTDLATTKENKFSDVNKSDWFYEQVVKSTK